MVRTDSPASGALDAPGPSSTPDTPDAVVPAHASLASFEQWYRHEHPRLLAVLTLSCGDAHVAQDVTAEAFARALGAWRRVQKMDQPAAWTYRVAVNLARRRARRAANEQRVLRRLGAPAAVPDAALRTEVWDAVRALPDRERLAVALRYVAGCSEREVAERMNVTLGTASSTLAHARRQLARMLGTDQGADDA